jgi:Rrf2 family iron-sulfur cluster assembly transcriptional regulator
MMLTTKGRYAVMALVDLATHGKEKPVVLAEIAERQEIALTYLEQIFSKLKKDGIVHAFRGPGGGYKLTKPAAETWISDIIVAVDEPIKMTRCNHDPSKGCLSTKARCLTHDLWDGLGNQIFGYLRSVSLEDVCARRVRERTENKFMDMNIDTAFAKSCSTQVRPN